MEDSFLGFLIACGIMVFLALGFVWGEKNSIKKIDEANKTCWQTHAVFVKYEGEYGGEFKCYRGGE